MLDREFGLGDQWPATIAERRRVSRWFDLYAWVDSEARSLLFDADLSPRSVRFLQSHPKIWVLAKCRVC